MHTAVAFELSAGQRWAAGRLGTRALAGTHSRFNDLVSNLKSLPAAFGTPTPTRLPPSELRTSDPRPGLGLRLCRPVASGRPLAASVRAEGDSLRAGPPWSPERRRRRGDATWTSTLPHPPRAYPAASRARPGGEQAGLAGVTHDPGAGSGVPRLSAPRGRPRARGATEPRL